MAAKNVNIYSPGWIFFLIFFLVFNIYVLVHHTYHNNVRKSFKPQPIAGDLKSSDGTIKSAEDFITDTGQEGTIGPGGVQSAFIADSRGSIN